MPKRSFDIGVEETATFNYTMPADKVQRKTERSHEENQERAYVAASRRADRSIEARVQSARMASEIHKKRTGKGFRITEEIVMREEMYEEEDDDLPRSYRLLGPQLQTASQEMNMRVEEYLHNRVAMSALLAGNNQLWRENEINKLFDQSFPNAQRQAQQLSQHLPGQHHHLHHGPQLMDSLPQSPVVAPNFHPVNYHLGPHHHDRGQSMPAISPTEFSHHGDPNSPLIATPGSDSGMLRTRASLSSGGSSMTPSTPIDLGSSPSLFTTELPPEAKMLMEGMSMNDAYSQPLCDIQDWVHSGMAFDAAEMTGPVKMDPAQPLFEPVYYQDGVTQQMNMDQFCQGSGPPVDWNTFIDEGAWNNDR